jgi:hypothetical protein
VIEVSYEMGEYVAWAPDALLIGFGTTEGEARASLLDHAADSYVELNDYLHRDKLSRHLAETIPAIARLLAVEKA